MRLEQVDLDEWEGLLPGSGFEVFHTTAALRVLDRHTDSQLRCYAVLKGEEPVGLWPAFVRSYGVGRLVTSPPAGKAVPRLGPLVMPTSPKQRKRETAYREVIDLVLDDVDADAPNSLVRFECPLAFDDPRPFQWSEMDVDQSFTYVLDLEGRSIDDVRDGFSRDFRREVRKSLDTDLTVSVEGIEAAMDVYDDVFERYSEQGETFPVAREYFRDLVLTLDDRCRTYVARGPSDEYQSGIVVLYSNDVASFWQGGVRASYDGISANSRIHWEIIADVVEDDAVDVTAYDLVGANTPRLSRYKAKFGADLEPYHTVESAGFGMTAAKRFYTTVKK